GDRAGAKRERDGDAQRPPRERRGNERVLVLSMDHVRAYPPGHSEDGERRPAVEEGVREPLRGRQPPPGLEPLGKRKPDDVDAVVLLARRGAPVRRHDRHAVAAPGQRMGERIEAPLRTAWRKGREVLVDEANVHGRTRATTRKPVDSWGRASATARFQRLSRE